MTAPEIDLAALKRNVEALTTGASWPDCILALIERLERAEAENARLRDACVQARSFCDQRVMEDLSTDEPPKAWWDARDSLRLNLDAALAQREGR